MTPDGQNILHWSHRGGKTMRHSLLPFQLAQVLCVITLSHHVVAVIVIFSSLEPLANRVVHDPVSYHPPMPTIGDGHLTLRKTVQIHCLAGVDHWETSVTFVRSV